MPGMRYAAGALCEVSSLLDAEMSIAGHYQKTSTFDKIKYIIKKYYFQNSRSIRIRIFTYSRKLT